MSTTRTASVWGDPSYPAKARVAHWLCTVVKEGNVFTTGEMRNAIPGVAQVDRRMRDLRKQGWVIETYRENGQLKSHERLLQKVGARVWEGS